MNDVTATYVYKVVAMNGKGEASSNEVTFTPSSRSVFVAAAVCVVTFVRAALV